jgi:flagellar hook-associated protein 3 FlgL
MTTIRPYAAGAYVTQRNTQQILELKNQLGGLTTQLSTGRVSETYAGLGVGRTTSLTAHATLSALDGYDSAIGYGQTRAQLATASLNGVISFGTELKANLANGLVRSSSGSISSATLARNGLDAAVNALNQTGAGTYIFGGRDSETEPVLDTATILNGDGTKAGVAQLVADQIKADLGSDGMGRLTSTAVGGTGIRLSESSDAEVRSNFGFLIAAAPTVTGTAIGVSNAVAGAQATGTPTFNALPTEGQAFRVVVNLADGSQKTVDVMATKDTSAGDLAVFKLPVADAAAAQAQLLALVAPGTIASAQSPTVPGTSTPLIGLSVGGGQAASFTLDVTAQPAVGDTVTIKLALHDGTTTSITLTARAAPTSGGAAAAPGTFAIVPGDNAATAANLKTALDAAVKLAAGSSLTASATVRAATDFFDGSSIDGLAARRINPAGTGYVQTPSTGTVQWYRGEDAGTDPRQTATVQTGADSAARIGVRANEAPLRAVLAGMAAVALGTPAGSDPDANNKWQALADRASTLVRAISTSPSVQEIVTDLSLANTAMSGAKAQNATTRNIMENAMAGVEAADTTEVTTKLLDLQNRLQASYQVTATLSKLSLVNYMN